MGTRIWGLILTLLGLVIAVSIPLQASRLQEQAVGHPVTVRFDLYQDYLIVAHGTVGPFRDLNFLLDTGASPSIIDRRLAQKLHLEEVPAKISILEGSLQVGRAVLPQLEFGPLLKKDLAVVVEDLTFFRRTLPIRIDAVLGMDVLRGSSFVVDYAVHQIQFGPTPSLPISVPLQPQKGLAVFEAELNNSVVHLLVDTGAPSLVLFEARLPQSAEIRRSGDVRKVTNLVGQVERKAVRLNRLRLGREVFRQEQAFVVADRGGSEMELDGLFSPSALGFTRLSVDFENGILGFGR